MSPSRPVRWTPGLSDELDRILYVPPMDGDESHLRQVDNLLYGRERMDASVTLPEEVWDHWISWVRRRQREKLDTVIVISGRKGMGKSTLGLRLCRELDDRFSLDQVVYRAADMADLFVKLRVQQCAMYDEAALGLLSTDWATAEARELVHSVTILRPKRLTLVLCLPRFKRLNASFREDLVDLWIRINVRGFATVHPALETERYSDYRGVGWFPDREWNPLTWASLQGDPEWHEYEKHRWTQSERYLKASAQRIGRALSAPGAKRHATIDAVGAERRFICPPCGLSFERRDNLKRHFDTKDHRLKVQGKVAQSAGQISSPSTTDTASPSSGTGGG